MDSSTIAFAILATTLAGVAWQAWRLGNEKRDVALLGAKGALCAIGAVVTALV